MNPIQQLLQGYGIHAEHLPTFADVADYDTAIKRIKPKMFPVKREYYNYGFTSGWYEFRDGDTRSKQALKDHKAAATTQLSKRSADIIMLIKQLKNPTIQFEDCRTPDILQSFPAKRITITTATGKYSGIITIDAYNQIINNQK
jgi:hypothetical protein